MVTVSLVETMCSRRLVDRRLVELIVVVMLLLAVGVSLAARAHIAWVSRFFGDQCDSDVSGCLISRSTIIYAV
mgnify:CR=1 FL=1